MKLFDAYKKLELARQKNPEDGHILADEALCDLIGILSEDHKKKKLIERFLFLYLTMEKWYQKRIEVLPQDTL